MRLGAHNPTWHYTIHFWLLFSACTRYLGFFSPVVLLCSPNGVHAQTRSCLSFSFYCSLIVLRSQVKWLGHLAYLIQLGPILFIFPICLLLDMVHTHLRRRILGHAMWFLCRKCMAAHMYTHMPMTGNRSVYEKAERLPLSNGEGAFCTAENFAG